MNSISKGLSFCLWAVLVFAGCSCKAPQQKKELAWVVNIADGDTFTLLYTDKSNVKVRLYGIDTPERGQDFGTAARTTLGEMLKGHLVSLYEKNKDRYGRTVAVAFRDDGLCINEEMLRLGYAWHYGEYDKNPAWKELEQQAKKKKLGLWAGSKPTPPWEWRKMKRKPKAT
jgi:endonuclease YncB( thermonuclease family)